MPDENEQSVPRVYECGCVCRSVHVSESRFMLYLTASKFVGATRPDHRKRHTNHWERAGFLIGWQAVAMGGQIALLLVASRLGPLQLRVAFHRRYGDRQEVGGCYF